MRNFLALAVLSLLLSCTTSGDPTSYNFVVENQSSDTVQVCTTNFDTQPFYNHGSNCVTLAPTQSYSISTYYDRGILIDYWKGNDPVVFTDLDIYKDSVLVVKDFLERDLWIYSQDVSYQAEYRLILTDSVLN